jgi:hypothetical protein
MASCISQRISDSLRRIQGTVPKQRAKIGQSKPTNANDHEQKARVHPAQPSYSVVVPAPVLSSINVAVLKEIGTIRAWRKCHPVSMLELNLTVAPLSQPGLWAPAPAVAPAALPFVAPAFGSFRSARSAHKRSRPPTPPPRQWPPECRPVFPNSFLYPNRPSTLISQAALEVLASGYFAAALCLMNAVTTSFCADAIALFAVVMCAPASTSGNCNNK